MKQKFRAVSAALASAWSKVPASVKTQGTHVVLAFAATFVATAAPAIPSLWQQVQLGKLPSLSVVHALLAASAAAAVKAAVPVARAGAVAHVTGLFGWVKARRAAKFQKAVDAYLAVKAAAEAQESVQQAPQSETVPDPVSTPVPSGPGAAQGPMA